MASVVCQGLQSCLEPRLVEPLVLRHKLSPPPSPLPQEEEEEGKNGERINKKKIGAGGWSFLKALETPSSQPNNHVKTDEVYVHPMVKRTASALSTKSLEMCTESLGSETGSEVSESGDEFPSLSSEERERLRAIQRSKSRVFDRKMQNSSRGDFPPPLTSISGSDATVKVRPHREGGRLVIKAVSVSNCGTNFKAERTNGRLKLSLFKDCSVNCESGRFEKKDEVCIDEAGDQVETENEYDATEEEEEEEVDDDDDDDEEEGGGWGLEMDGKRRKNGNEIGMGELKRLTRCKEGGSGSKVIASWSPWGVAIS